MTAKDISGSKKGGGGGGFYEADSTLQATATVRVLEVISEGPIRGLVGGAKGIYLNNVPVENDDGTKNFGGTVVWDQRWGYPDQSFIAGFPSASNPVSVGTQITNAVPVIFTVSNSTIDAVNVNIGLNDGLAYNDTANNRLEGTSVDLAIDHRLGSGTWVQVSTIAFNDKTTSPYSQDYRVERPKDAGLWSIRVRRITADNGSTVLKNATYLNRVTEIDDVKLAYPNTALVGIAVDAKTVGSTSIPTRSYLADGLLVKVPSNYNTETRAYTGVWDGTFKFDWTDNPAWVVYDLLAHPRYGLGDRISEDQIDKYSFYNAAVYNDELVDIRENGVVTGQRPRFTFNYPLTVRQDAAKWLQEIAGTMNAKVIWLGGQATILQDRPGSVAKILSTSNVIDGRFDYRSTALQDRITAVNVTWNDPDNHYQQAVVTVDKYSTFGAIQTQLAAIDRYESEDIAALGCTSEHQARAVGVWKLDTVLNQTQSVSFKMFLNGYDLFPGEIVAIADDFNSMDSAGGRLLTGSTSSVLLLDHVGTMTAGDEIRVLINNALETRTSTSVVDNLDGTMEVHVSPAFSATPADHADYQIITASEYSEYRITKVALAEDGTVAVEAIQHDPNKYARIEEGVNVPAPTFLPVSSSQVGTPTSLLFREVNVNEDNTIVRSLNISWQRPVVGVVTNYIVKYQVSNGGWQQLTANGASVELPQIIPGAYDVEVYAVGFNNVLSPKLSGSYTVSVAGGSSSDLLPVTGLTVIGGGTTFDKTSLDVVWTNPSGNLGVATLRDFEVKVFTTADVLLRTEYIAAVAPGQTQGFSYSFDKNLADGGPRRSVKVSVKCRDANNNLSVANTVTFTNDALAAPTGITVTGGVGSLFVSWVNPTDVDYAGTMCWVSGANGFTPSAANKFCDGKTTFLALTGLSASTTYYVRVGAYDSFAKSDSGTGMNLSAQYTASTSAGEGVPSGATNPGSGTEGDLFFNTTDGKLYRFHAGAWTSAITSTDIPAGAVDLTKFAAGIEPVSVVSSVPGALTTKTIVNTANGKLYRWNGSAYVADVASTDITGLLSDSQLAEIAAAKISGQITGTQITDSAITTPKIAAGSIVASKMLITAQGTAINDDPMFVDSSAWTLGGSTVFGVGTSATGAVANSYIYCGSGTDAANYSAKLYPIGPGKTYRLSANLYAGVGNDRNMYVFVQFYDTNGDYISSAYTSWGGTMSGYVYGGQPPANAWTRCGAQFGAGTDRLIPTLARTCQIGVWFQYSGSGSSSVGQAAQDLRLEEVVTSDLIVDGTIYGTKLVTGSVSTDQLAANSITTGKIAAGAVNADQIAAGAIRTDKLFVTGRGKALNDDPSCMDITAWPWTPAPSYAIQADSTAPVGTTSIRCTNGTQVQTRPYAVEAGKTYKISLYAKQVSGGGLLYIRQYCYNSAGTNVGYIVLAVTPDIGSLEAITVPGTWTRYVGYSVPPATAVQGNIFIHANWNTIGVTDLCDIRAEEYIGADLIVDGSISTTKLAADSVTADKILANTITGGKIAASTISGSNIAGETITAGNLAANTITGDKIAANTVSAINIDSRGLTIKDAGGTVVFSAGVPLTATYADAGLKNSTIAIDSSGNISGIGTGTGQSVANNTDSVIRAPGGGVFTTTTSSHTGALKIRLPQFFSNTMLRFTVEIYEYTTGYMATLEVGGYTYSASTEWINCSARVIGGSNVEYPVYFGHDGTKACIWISQPSESWSYPQVRVRDFFAGYTNYDKASWESGWQISFDTAFTVVAGTGTNQYSASVTDTLPGADWSKTARRPANVAALGGSEPIQNTAIAIDSSGNLTGIGTGTGSSVANNRDGSINAPDGGSLSINAPGQYGAIKIKMPLLVGVHTTMFKMRVEIYEYITGRSCTLSIAGHTSSDTWYNVTASVIGGNVEYPVYFGHDGTNFVVWVGDPATEYWDYPQVFVKEVVAGYNHYNASIWSTGWNVSISTAAATNVSQTVTDTYPPADWTKTARKPTTLAGINATEGSKLGGISDNATSDITLVVRGVGLSAVGNTITRVGGDLDWTSDCYTVESFTGGAYASASPRIVGDMMFGLNTDPTTDSSYSSIDYAIYATSASTVLVYESGAGTSTGLTYVVGDVFAVTYDGANVRYSKNGTVFRTISAAAGLKLHFDSSIATQCSWSNVRFGPYGNPSAVSPTNKIPLGGASTYIENAAITSALIDYLATTNYAEDGGGNPSAGAKLSSSGTALKVASGSLQVGDFYFTDYWARLTRAIDGGSGTNVVWRGNNEPTTLGGAPNIDCVDLYSQGCAGDAGGFLWATFNYKIQPTAVTDNLDSLRYMNIDVYEDDGGASAQWTQQVQVTDRLYANSTNSNSANATKGSFILAFRPAAGVASFYAGSAPHMFSGHLLVTLYNAYGPSAQRWFHGYPSASNTIGTAMTRNTTAPSGGPTAGSGGGTGGIGGYCPAPWVMITLESGKKIPASDLYEGAKVLAVRDTDMQPVIGTVHYPRTVWQMRYQLALTSGKKTEFSHNHRFYVVGKGFTKIQDLRAGDLIAGPVESIVESVIATGDGPVIAFEVKGAGTYFGDDLLSHNLKYDDPS